MARRKGPIAAVAAAVIAGALLLWAVIASNDSAANKTAAPACINNDGWTNVQIAKWIKDQGVIADNAKIADPFVVKAAKQRLCIAATVIVAYYKNSYHGPVQVSPEMLAQAHRDYDGSKERTFASKEPLVATNCADVLGVLLVAPSGSGLAGYELAKVIKDAGYKGEVNVDMPETQPPGSRVLTFAYATTAASKEDCRIDLNS